VRAADKGGGGGGGVVLWALPKPLWALPEQLWALPRSTVRSSYIKSKHIALRPIFLLAYEYCPFSIIKVMVSDATIYSALEIKI
jgi:hypothetical protein